MTLLEFETEIIKVEKGDLSEFSSRNVCSTAFSCMARSLRNACWSTSAYKEKALELACRAEQLSIDLYVPSDGPLDQYRS